MGLRDLFKRFIGEYRSVFEEVWKTGIFANEFGNFVRRDIASEVSRIANSVSDVYISKGSVGQTKWTPVPWIAVFDNRITHKATEGEYIVYLLNSERQELYLTFNQASEGKNNASVRQKLKEKSVQIREKMIFPDSVSLEAIDSGNMAYDVGCICSLKYSLNELPEEKQLVDDLLQFINIYAKYYAIFYNSGGENADWWPSKEDYPLNLTKEDWKKYILEVELPNHPSPMKMLKGMMLLGGEASCKQLSEAYGGPPSAYAGCAMNLGRRVKKHFNLSPCMDGEQERYFPFPFIGKYRGGNEDNYLYRIRVELYEALKEVDLSEIDPKYERGEEKLSTKDILQHINTYIKSKGFIFDEGLVENYYLSLKSKPFVILAGTSGTGKTRLVRLFAEAVGANADNGRYKLVAVRPDWSDSSDLFGHVDLNGTFVPGAIIDFINTAEWDLEHPYFLCLDEMNLARVEYYLSDILSILETSTSTKK